MFSRRIRDGVLNKLVLGWLKAGVLHEEQVTTSKEGTPQGGIVSPLLSNLYLHEVLDDWFVREVQPRMKGAAQMVRYADDAVLCFEQEEDAKRVLAVLGKRMAKYGLKLHPEKTKLVDFRPPQWGQRKGRGSFSFLGFCFYWGRSRKGRAIVKLKTAKERWTRTAKTQGEWLRRNRHQPVATQHAQLSVKLRGHFQYFGVTFNSRAPRNLVEEVKKRWRVCLNRRGGRKGWSWERFASLLVTYPYPLPRPRIIHHLFD